MADEYITKEQAVAACKEVLNPSITRFVLAKHAIEAIPPEDVAPVRHGRWREGVYAGYKCSECRTTWDAPTNYCPNCGAKMDTEGNNA